MFRFGLILYFCILSACSTSGLKKTKATEVPPKSQPKILQKKIKTALPTQVPGSESIKSIICENESDERKISILQPKLGGCRVEYTKFGKSKSVASAVNGRDHCTKVFEKIKTNLEKADFECKYP